MPFDVDAALRETVRLGASDLHVKVPSPPRVRIGGDLVPLAGYGRLTAEDTAGVYERVLRSETRRARFESKGSADLSYHVDDSRFRVAAFRQRGSHSFVFRTVPRAPDVVSLGLPEAVTTWADAHRGLIVVSGPTGAGKSTTSAALLELVNRRRACHIITIEDPIEYLHSDQQAIVSQREIGIDAASHHDALHSALRQDPDVILIGEVRDEETAMTALRAAETGHLVICTLHTLDAAETIHRFVELFENRNGLVRQMLASTLVGIVSQRLVPKLGGGQILNAEVLVNTARVRDLISGAVSAADLTQAIAEGDYYGMRTFDQCLLGHVNAGRVDHSQALSYATSPHDFKLMLMGAVTSRGMSGGTAHAAPGLGTGDR